MGNERRFLGFAAAMAAAVMLSACAGPGQVVKLRAPWLVSGSEQTIDAGEAGRASGPASLISPMVEKRETITATGYAVIAIQNHRNPAQQRLMAIRASKLDAYRSLTEQVYGQYLDATTTVADMTVLSDTFKARVEGVIHGATVVSITPVGDDTYETTLSLDRAVVRDLRALYLTQLASRKR
jgi:outer membrane protein FlgP